MIDLLFTLDLIMLMLIMCPSTDSVKMIYDPEREFSEYEEQRELDRSREESIEM